MRYKEREELISTLKDNIKLYHKYDEVHIELLRTGYYSHYMPTEVVINEPKLVVPQSFREYRTELYLVNNTIHDYGSLVKTPEWQKNSGTSNYDKVHLFEVYSDCGDDGHIHNLLSGWVFIDSNKIKEKQNDPEIKLCQYRLQEIINFIVRENEDV